MMQVPRVQRSKDTFISLPFKCGGCLHQNDDLCLPVFNIIHAKQLVLSKCDHSSGGKKAMKVSNIKCGSLTRTRGGTCGLRVPADSTLY